MSGLNAPIIYIYTLRCRRAVKLHETTWGAGGRGGGEGRGQREGAEPSGRNPAINSKLPRRVSVRSTRLKWLTMDEGRAAARDVYCMNTDRRCVSERVCVIWGCSR